MSGNDVPSPGTPPTGGDPGFDAVIEDILAGRLGHEPEDDMSLVGLVDALRAPGSDEELGDVDAAASAFVSARTGAVVVPLASRRTGRAAVAVAAVVGGLLLVGGTAAAATGSLPDPVQDFVHGVVGAFPSSDATSTDPSQLASSDGDGKGTQGSGSDASRTNGTANRPSASALPTDDPSVAGLCQAFAGRTDSAATASTAYQRLLAAAQAEGRTVAQWCGVHAPAAGNPSPGKPSNAGNPSPGRPSNAGNPSPGKPSNAGNPSPGKPSTKPGNPSPGKPATPGANGSGRPSTRP